MDGCLRVSVPLRVAAVAVVEVEEAQVVGLLQLPVVGAPAALAAGNTTRFRISRSEADASSWAVPVRH